MDAGPTDREMSSVSRSTPGFYGNLQWQMLYILQPPAADV